MKQEFKKLTSPITFTPSRKGRLLQCAAVSVAAWVMANSPAHAAIPPECDVIVNPNIINCVVADPGTLEQVETVQDNTTIVIGSNNTPTMLVTAASDALSLTGNGAQTILVNESSIVNALNGRGILLTGNGLLSLSTAANSQVIGGNDDGINVLADGSININIMGNVSGFSDALLAINDGLGAIDITASGELVGVNNTGIAAVNSVNGTDVVIDTTGGTVFAPNAAIRGVNNGSGVLSITTADLFSVNGGNVGISAENEGTDLLINTTAGTIEADRNGIVAENRGSGDTIITTADINVDERDGIFALTSNSTDALIIDSRAGSIESGRFGVRAEHDGTGLAIIRVSNITVGSMDAINIDSNGTSLVINSAQGSLVGAQNGIVAANNNAGLLSIRTANVTGQDVVGIRAFNQGTSLTIDSRLGRVLGGNTGIRASNTGSGALTIRTADVTGQNDAGIFANNANGAAGELTIDTKAGTVNGNNTAIFAIHTGTGALSISTGNVNATLFDGIRAQTQANSTGFVIDTVDGDVIAGDTAINASHAGSGSMSITTGNVTGTDEFGILVLNTANTIDLDIDSSMGAVFGGTSGMLIGHNGTGHLSITTGDVTGQATSGIIATDNAGSSLIIDSTAGSVTGSNTGISAINDGLANGMLSITTGNVTATAGIGILARNQIGTDLIINSAAGSVTANDTGIVAINSGSRTLNIQTADVTGQGGFGIFAQTNNLDSTDILIDSIAGDIVARTTGVDVSHIGSGSVFIATGDVTGASENGILAANSGNGTDIAINSNMGAVLGGLNGIGAMNEGTGRLSIITADVSGTNGVGIFAGNSAAGTELSVDSSAGSVNGAANGILASNAGSEALSITAANVTGAGNIGIGAVNGGTDLTVDSSAGSVTGEMIGIGAENLGSGRLDLITANVTGLNAVGVQASNSVAGTGLTIDTLAGSVNANFFGISAINDGSSDLSITSADVNSEASDGISASNNNGGDLIIDSSAGSITGFDEAIDAQQNGAGALTITTADVTGTTGSAIIARNFVGSDLSVNTTAGTVSGALSGIFADNDGIGNLSVSTGDVNSANNIGIAALNGAAGNNLTIDSSAGSVAASFWGIRAENEGVGSLSVTTSNVTSATSEAIRALNGGNGANLTVDSSAGSITGATDGIRAVNSGSGMLSIITADVSAGSGTGIIAGNSGSSLVINTSAGTVSGDTNGIIASQNGAGTLSITTGDVNSSGDGVAFQTAGGQATVNNEGTILSGGFAVFATNASLGNVAVNNNGTIFGNVSLGMSDSVFNNNGIFNAIGDSDFGAGNDVFFNNGELEVLGNVKYDGLELLNNSGRISMADGNVGDSLSITGQYLGSGGRLDIDVSFDAMGSSDLLIVDGSATGSTIIDISGSGQIQGFGTSIRLVDAGAGTDADAFELEGGSVVSLGLLNVALTFDAVNNDFLLDSAIGTPVFQALKFTEGAQSLWYRSADAWAMHVDSKRHTDTDRKSPLWLQLYGATSDHDDSFDFASGGFTQEISLDYSQDYFGLQGGVEFGPGNAGEGVFYGLTTGYASSNLGFDGTADRVRYSAFNFGAYVGYQKGGFFANGLAKYDIIDADVNATSAGYTADLNGNAYGLRLESGYRWMSGNFFIEPSANLEYQKTDLDSFDALGASFDFDSFDGLRGTAGVRLGGETKTNGDNTLTYYVGLKAVHEFEGDGNVTFSTPMSSVAITNNAIDTYGRVDLGLNIATKGGVTGFIEGNADVSGDYTGFGGRVGLRIAF